MPSVFETPQQQAVASDQDRAAKLLELVKWASGLRGVQQLGRSYGPPAKAIYEAGSGQVGGVSLKDFVENTGAFAPGGAIQGAGLATPGGVLPAVASGFQGLAPIAGAAGTGLTGGRTNMFGGAIVPPALRRTAGAIAQSRGVQNIDDIEQAGQLAGLERVAKKPTSGPEYLKTARSAMRNWRQEGSRAEGVDVNASRILEKATAKLGDVGTDKLLAEVQRMNPKLTSGWTTDTIHEIRANKRLKPLSLNAPVGEGEDATEMVEGLAGVDRTDLLASIREQIGKLSPAMQNHAQMLITGEKDVSELNPKTLASLRQQLSGGKPISGKAPRTISGGSGGGGVMSDAEYQAAGREELARLQAGGQRTQRTVANDALGSNEAPLYQQKVSNPWTLDQALYHVSPQGPGIAQSGRIEARTSLGGASGGLGGAAQPGISTSPSLSEADETARMLARYGHVARQGDLPDDTIRTMALLDGARKGLKGPQLQAWADSAVAQQALGKNVPVRPKQPNGISRLSQYYTNREAVLDQRNPYMMFPDSAEGVERKTRQLQNIQPEGIRTYKISPGAIPKGTNVHMGTDPNEVRVPADIPVNQTTAYKYAPGSLLGLLGAHLIRHRKEDAE